MNKNDSSYFQEIIHKHYNPALVIFDINYYIKYITKEAKNYIQTPEDFTKAYNLLSFGSKEVRAILRTTMVSMKKKKDTYIYQNILLSNEMGQRIVDIIIEPLPPQNNTKEKGRFDEGYYVLLFKEKVPLRTPEKAIDIVGKVNFTLQEELDVMELNLYKAIAKLERSNQDLLATNEELQSTNEEYISVNEELKNINSEHEQTIIKFTQAKEDIDHLLQSTKIGTVFLDAELCIRKFTKIVKNIINIELQDIGRKIKSFTNKLEYDDFLLDIKWVLKHRKKIEKEVKAYDDIWYLVQISPYRLNDQKKDENGVVISFVNINKLKKTEKALQESELLYRTIFECANDGIVLFNGKDQRPEAVNKKQLEIFNMSEKEYLNTPYQELFAPKQNNNKMGIGEYIKHLIQDDSTFKARQHWLQKRKDGSLIETEVTTVIMPPPFKEYSINIVRDITDQKAAANKLEKSEKYYRTLFEKSMNGVMIFDPEANRVKTANDKICKIFECTKSELLSLSPHDFMPFLQANGEATSSFFKKKLETILTVGEVRHHMLLKSRTNKIIQVNIAAYLLSPKKDKHIVVIVNDITHQNKVAKVLEDTEVRFKAIFNNSYAFIALTNAQGEVIESNEAARKHIAEPNEMKANKDLWLYSCFSFDKKVQDRIKVDIQKVIGGKSINGQVSYQNNKKEIGILDYSMRAITDKNNKLQHILIESRDITKLLTIQKELNQKVKELEQKNAELQKYIRSNLELEKFAYVTSHDLREPLRTIGGFAQLLLLKHGKYINKEANEFINYIINATKNMNQLIEDLLKYSKVDNQDYSFSKVDLPKLLQRIIKKLDDLIHKNKAKINIKINNLPRLIRGNEIKLTQLFQNLIINAIKFHREEDTIIYITAKETPTHYQFQVADNGIGIEEDFYDKIFLIFKRLHPKEIYSGSGIGLAICKKIVEQHDGQIWVESTIDKGSNFYFTLLK